LFQVIRNIEMYAAEKAVEKKITVAYKKKKNFVGIKKMWLNITKYMI